MNTTNATDTLESGDDVRLISAIAEGDRDAFEQLVHLHGARMMSVARRFLRCEEDVNDAIQDALVCAFKNAGRFEGNSRLSTWLHRITVNACLMKLRSQRRRHEVKVEDLLPTFDETGHRTSSLRPWNDGPVEAVTSSETRQQVRECIDRLPDDYRTVLLMRDIEQLDTDETAKLLDCSPACVKTRLHRARMALRELLTPIFAADRDDC
jgi:RNA polymerase sigma-70 factor (ECF subfamily)